MELKTLRYETRDRVAIVTINRPDKLNALNAQTKQELETVLGAVRDDPQVDAVIMTGAGEKAFVAGTDIAELAELTPETGEAFSTSGQSLFDRIESSEKPFIAAVNGYALGGGCELALACHIRIASSTARFGQPEVSLGIIPGYGGTQRLPRLIGRGPALEMILSGTPIEADEALRLGLVNRVVPPEKLLESAMNLARRIASQAQPAVRLAIRAVNVAEETTLSEGLGKESGLFGECCGTGDFKEGVRAFLEKRRPKFTGS
jgi:enoyl-CoA hydratase